MLAAEDLTLPYGLAPGFSLAVATGERVAILGPNGAGKTTLIRALAGVLRPTAGVVRLDGQPLSALPPKERARQLAWVPQDTGLALDFTVEEAVALGRHPWRRALQGAAPGDQAAVDAALRRADLEPLRRRRVRTLSGGEQQRVVLARAFAQSPRVLLLDEPTAHLDLAHRAATLDRVSDEALTVVAVLHDLNLAALYFPRLVLMAAGAVLADGPPEAVMTPTHLERAFGIPVDVVPHPTAGVPQVLARRWQR